MKQERTPKPSQAELAMRTQQMIMQNYIVEDTAENTLFLQYQGFYLQVSFTDQHPLMYFQFVRNFRKTESRNALQRLNELNLKSVLGTHSMRSEGNCYIYRTVHWLDCEIPPARFFQILQRCADEAFRGYAALAGA